MRFQIFGIGSYGNVWRSEQNYFAVSYATFKSALHLKWLVGGRQRAAYKYPFYKDLHASKVDS